ncbi:glycosyltransferase [Asticcacaulis solisilvae]|uniref:glycosyltransferase n=1 Tax=Asticcacaulis solisilvae TaxID=1217274 RepID=UPI003FD845EB
MTPRISIIIPAFNAERTLGETLDSVIAQTLTDWEAIVVDDGSGDGTRALAEAIAAREPRIRVVSQANGGVSSARNLGLSEAKGAFGLFLDADDSLLPRHLETLAALVSPDTIAVCAYAYRTPEGGRVPATLHAGLADRAVAMLSDFCALAIHAALVPLDAVRATGGFDTRLRTCEDWDLWLRLARSGVGFATTPEVLALYHMQPASLSSDGSRVVGDAETVIRRARAADPRLPRDISDPAALTPLDEALTVQVFWYAACHAAAGKGIPDWFEARLPKGPLRFAPDKMLGYACSALMVGGNDPGTDFTAIWQARHAPITAMLRTIEARGTPGLTAAALYPFEQWLMSRNALDDDIAFSLVTGVRLELGALRDLSFPPEVSLAHIRIVHDGADVLRLEMPVWSTLPATAILARLFEFSSRADLKASGALDAVPAYRKLLLRESLHQIKRALTGKGKPSRHAAFLATLNRLDGHDGLSALVGQDGIDIMLRAKTDGAGERIAEASAPSPSHQAPEGSGYQDATFWETWFARENPWRYDSTYEQRKYEQSLSLIDGLNVGDALELASAEGHFTAQLAPRVGRLLATDISATALKRTAERCEGFGNVATQVVDVLNDAIPGDKDLIVVSEMLYYLEDRGRLKTAAGKIAGALKPGGRILSAHAYLVSDAPDKPGFDWDLPYGAATIADTFAATDGLMLEKSIQTDLYRVDLWRKGQAAADIRRDGYDIPAPAVLRTLFPDGQKPGVAEARQATTRTVPVLMYHRVAETSGPLKRYAVTPRQFDDQLRMLKSHGFHTLTAAEFAWYREGHAPLKGRPVILTFDDAYQDFTDAAFPVLRRHGFTAEVFVVTDKTGTAADWDAEYGPPAPLMDWAAIARLSEAGIAFGSHLATHRKAETLTSGDLLYEAVKSRTALETRLGKTIRSIAAPYGNLDQRAQRIFHYAGYETVFSTDDGIATFDYPLNRLPRIEVHDEMDADALAARLGVL